MKRQAEIKRLDIVLLGDFNPKIFTPAWFFAFDLLGEKESQDCEIEVIHTDVAIFSLDWFRLQVTRDRFSIITEQEAYFEKLFDLVIGTFKLLSHTPLRAIGVNWGGHYKASSEEEWHEFGHFLVPQSPWNNILSEPATLKVEVTEKYPPEDVTQGAIQIQIQPSPTIQQAVFINLNDHYKLPQPELSIGCDQIISLFEENKNKSQQKFENLTKNIFDNFESRKK